MGKTSKPVSVLVTGMDTPPELAALSEQGHTVLEYTLLNWQGEPLTVDLIIGPRCWRWLPSVSEKWLPLILKEARAKQPARKKKEKK